MTTPTLKQLTCLRCGHPWWPRSLNRPGTCPKCGSAVWDRPREKATTESKS